MCCFLSAFRLHFALSLDLGDMDKPYEGTNDIGLVNQIERLIGIFNERIHYRRNTLHALVHPSSRLDSVFTRIE